MRVRIIYLVRLFGILTLGLAVSTFLFGYYGWNFFHHFRLAIATVAMGIVHGSLVAWMHLRARIRSKRRR